MMNELVSKAREFAKTAHESINQRRKWSNEPYFVHCAAVAAIVAGVEHTPEMLAAAFLHDVVEDTPVTLKTIHANFGDKVEELVWWLTDQSKPSDGNRATRKAIDRAHLAAAPPEAQTVKLADLIDNTSTIVEFDPNFAKVYLREKALLLKVMNKGNPTLMGIALTQIKRYDEVSMESAQ
jgi:(p)ppGpp synthase/HD superfamily hydrolase